MSIKNTLEVAPVNNPLPSDAGIDLIAQFEGFVSSAQPDPIGIATIGFGHVVLPNESFAEPITRDQGLAMLRADVERVVIPSLDQVNVTLSQNEVDALASFIFNVGPTAFRRSTLLRELNNGNIERVPDELRRFVHAGGRVLPGLVRRREAEASLFGN